MSAGHEPLARKYPPSSPFLASVLESKFAAHRELGIGFRHKIIVVDDQPQILGDVLALLQVLGFDDKQIILKENVEEALPIIKAPDFRMGIIISDFNIAAGEGKFNGDELVRNAQKGCLVIGMSGELDNKERFKAANKNTAFVYKEDLHTTTEGSPLLFKEARYYLLIITFLP